MARTVATPGPPACAGGPFRVGRRRSGRHSAEAGNPWPVRADLERQAAAPAAGLSGVSKQGPDAGRRGIKAGPPQVITDHRDRQDAVVAASLAPESQAAAEAIAQEMGDRNARFKWGSGHRLGDL